MATPIIYYVTKGKDFHKKEHNLNTHQNNDRNNKRKTKNDKRQKGQVV